MKIIMLVVAGAMVGIDQLLKVIVVNHLKPVGMTSFIPGFLDFYYVENRGMAFGLMQDQRWLFVVLTLALMILVVIALFRYKTHDFFTYTCCALLLGGGIGNLIDRVRQGFVVDYIKVSFFPPVFNFADCCVVVGMICFLIHIFFFMDKDEKDKKHAEKLSD